MKGKMSPNTKPSISARKGRDAELEQFVTLEVFVDAKLETEASLIVCREILNSYLNAI